MGLVECVPNFSNGRDQNIVDSIVNSISSVEGVRILNTELDPSHNRSVVSFVAPEDRVVEAAFRGIKEASRLIDMNTHTGEHPRFGSSDVIPFIPVSGVSMQDCVRMANDLGARVGKDLGIPVYLYAEAAKRSDRKNLEDIRNKNFQFEQLKEAIGSEKWKPDYGPAEVGKSGASIIGARDYLIAYNVYLNTKDMATGKKIASALRAKDGGLSFVKALAFFIEDKQMVQISMNLTNFRKTPIYRAFEMVKLEASRYGLVLVESEIVGLVPMDALTGTTKFYLRLNSFKEDQILESKLMEGTNKADEVNGFLNRLAEGTPTPGGGSASALVASVAAALSSMVSSLTNGKKKYEQYWDRMNAIASESRSLMEKEKDLMKLDEEAFTKVSSAWKLPKSTDEEKKIRAKAIEDASREAMKTPWEIARLSFRILELGSELIEKGISSAITDSGCAVLYSYSAIKGSLYNVQINLKSFSNKDYVEGERQKIKLFLQEAERMYDASIRKIDSMMN